MRVPRPFVLLLASTIMILAVLLASRPAEAQYSRISVAHDGSQADGDSLEAAISGNGRFVVFVSYATNLVPNDTNGGRDVFLRDLLTQTTTRVSVTSTGAQAPEGIGASMGEPVISDDGRIVVFGSGTALVPEDIEGCGLDGAHSCEDIYAYDRQTGAITLVSVAPDGSPAHGSSRGPRISADGRFVVFESNADNLSPDDPNNDVDLYIRDLVARTTTRINSGATAAWRVDNALRPAISADGRVIAFFAYGEAFPGEPDPACLRDHCRRIFIKYRETGQLVRLPVSLARDSDVDLVLDGTGRILGMGASLGLMSGDGPRYARQDWIDTLTGATLRSRTRRDDNYPHAEAAVTRDGRHLAEALEQLDLFDRVTAQTESVPGLWGAGANSPSFDASGRYLAFSSGGYEVVPDDTNQHQDVFVLDRDRDGDGMLTTWELQYGLDPDNAADAAEDPDGDGRTSLQEFQVDTHPRGQHRRYFAEGAANGFFDTRIAVLNPTEAPAHVQLRLLGENGRVVVIPRIVGAHERVTFALPAEAAPDSVFSTVIESDEAIVADRLTSWGAGGYGSSLETAIGAPATTWYFAEGATGAGFSLYYLLSNPGDTDASVVVEFLRPDGQPVLAKTVTVAAHARATMDVASQDPALRHALVSARLTSTQPIVAERSLYRSAGGLFDSAGHAGAGVAAPAPRWFLAEGATGFFDEFVLVANPNPASTRVTFTFLPQGGTPFADTRDVPAHSRFTLDVKAYRALAQAAVSIVVESEDQTTPIVVERAMWWPSGGVWYEASLSAGVTGTGTRWAIAEGEQGRADADPRHAGSTALTYVLVANTDAARNGRARIQLLFEGGGSAERTITVPRSGRATLDVSTIREAANKRFGIIVDSLDDVPIVVERSLYHNIDGVLYAAGATSVATDITPRPEP